MGPSDTQPPALCSGAAFSLMLAHGSTRTHTLKQAGGSSSGRSLGAKLLPPWLWYRRSPVSSSETVACPPTPHCYCVPARSNLAGSAEMSASSAPSGPVPAGYVGAKYQAVSVSKVPKSPLPQLLSMLECLCVPSADLCKQPAIC